uniref:Uncharacterized protein n=1 Tax=biofilter metagenome TaxID=1070537 RepID=A0A193SCY4_9ZZZZ
MLSPINSAADISDDKIRKAASAIVTLPTRQIPKRRSGSETCSCPCQRLASLFASLVRRR